MATNKREPPAPDASQAQRPKRKRVRIKAGQLVAVPLMDGTFALLHVAKYAISVIVAHYAHRRESPEKLLEGLEDAMQHKLIAMLEITSDGILDGDWPVIGYREPAYPEAMLDRKGHSSTSPATVWLFEAYYGLRPWDGMAVPNWYGKKLLPGVPVPPTVRYKRDFERDAAAAAAAAANTPAPPDAPELLMTEGPCVIHIEITYEGEGLPSIPLLKRRQAIETGLESAGVGNVTDAGGGGGVMDIFLETNDVARAMPFVLAAVKEAGFENDARIETEPIGEDEDEGDEEESSS